MKINRNNYEAWLLDLFEGNLSPEQEADVALFLEQNPDLKVDAEEFDKVSLPPEKQIRLDNSFTGKLKRPIISPVGKINSSNYEDFFIAWYEDTLRDDEKVNLEQFLHENPEFNEEFLLYGKIKLPKEKGIIYPDKNSLKKTAIIPLYSKIGVIASVAAACIAVLLIFKPFTQSTVSNDQISMLQTKPFILSAEAPEIAMRPTTATLVHYESVVNNFTSPEPDPESTIPPTMEQQIYPMPKLRPVPLPVDQAQQFVPPSNEYTLMMDYLRMREEMETAQAQQGTENKTLAEKMISGLSKDMNKSNKKVSVLSVLEYGITQYHKLTNKPVTVEKEINDEGETSAFKISTENFGVAHRKAEK